MTKTITAALLLTFITASALASDFKSLRSEVEEARNTLLVLLKDKTKRGTDQQKLVKDSADKVSISLSQLVAPKGKEKDFEELKKTWSDFKASREKELVPLILKDQQDKADQLANGVQKERMGKMKKIIESFIGGDI